MTVEELIDNLKELPPHNKVRIAFDMGIRMDVTICEIAKDEGEQIVVLTDKDEWEDRQHW